MKNKLLIALIISIILFVVVLVITLINPNKQENINEELNTAQVIALLKHTMYDLNVSSTLQEGSITTDSMIKFALSYMGIYGGYNISYTENNTTAIANKQDIKQVVSYIFGKQVDFTDISFKTTANSIYVPINRAGTDAQIYKFKSKEYDESEDTYTAYIDVLEVGALRFSEIIEGSVTEYDESDVMFTFAFKYKVEQGRNILMAYNIISNW